MAEQACDLIMKGGITSGVIYPRLVARLSLKYRFRSIGGTSAGAIAAAACAAAEHARSHAGRGRAGFDKLAALPGELGERVGPRHSRLLSLFQPEPGTAWHFDVFTRALNRSGAQAAVAVTVGLVHGAWFVALIVGLLGSLLVEPWIERALPWLTWTLPGLPVWATGWLLALALCAGLAVLSVGLAQALSSCWNDRRRGAVLPPLVLAVTLTAGVAIGALQIRGVLDLGAWRPGSLGAAAMAVLVALGVDALVLGAVALWFLRSLARGLHANGYGLCSGQTRSGAPHARNRPAPGLTDWLTDYLDELAGRRGDAAPLTFGDLWGAREPGGPDAIHLEVMTTALSQQMVYALPLREGSPRFHFDEAEWRRLFPARVIDHLARCAPASERVGLPPGTRVVGPAGRSLRPLPDMADLPVVVAVRLSLSFPLLLSAVPLHALDFSLRSTVRRMARLRSMPEAERGRAPLHATRVWFSDGGIGSNLPLHLFDALLPGHPTFAVNLKPEHPSHKIRKHASGSNEDGRVYLPEDARSGRIRHWRPPPDGTPLGGLAGFLGAIVGTMQNWRDEIQFPYPGFRDRIVQISQRADEGGLNLTMPPQRIATLAKAGELAAVRLIDRFHPEGVQRGAGWDQHRAFRLGGALATLQPTTARLAPQLSGGSWQALVPGLSGYAQADRQLAVRFLDGLTQLAALPGETDRGLDERALRPIGQVRITPRI